MRRRVVVTGLGSVAPNGLGTEAFWSSTRAGRSGIRSISGFDVSSYPTRIAGQIVGFREEDHVDPRDARHVPRVTALALAAATEALAGAALDPPRLDLAARRRFATVVGSGGVGLAFAEAQWREYYLGNPKAVSLYTIPSSTPGSISSEVAMRFDVRGPSHVLSTGCTSSTDALGHALSLIRHGQADRALAGGADAPLAPGILRGFCLLKILTASWNDDPARASRPFSKDRDGFVLAEGAWFLVLEEREHARARGATILGEILGYGATCEAFHRVRLDESGEEPARAMALALEDAGLAPEQVDYVNLHGTSTQLNDRVETRAVKLALGRRAKDVPCSSLKSMVGHPQGACGAAGVVASLLAMRDRFLPPTINRDEPDPDCDLDVLPHEGRSAETRAALCNCIGFGSKNAALVVGAPDR